MSDQNTNRKQNPEVFSNLKAHPGALGHGLLSQRNLYPSQPALHFNQQTGFTQMVQPVINIAQQQQSRRAYKIGSSGEKAGPNKSCLSLDKYEKKVVESYEKQARKLEATYKNICLALESHKKQQLNALRTLLDKQKALINRARSELEDILGNDDLLTSNYGVHLYRGSIGPDESETLTSPTIEPSLASSGQRRGENSRKNNSSEKRQSNPPNQIEQVKQLNHSVWQRLQFVSIDQSHPVLSPKGAKAISPCKAFTNPVGENTPDAELLLPRGAIEEQTGVISSFLNQLDNCMHLLTSTEWHERRKKKKREKAEMKQGQTLSPAMLNLQKQQYFFKDEVTLRQRVVSPPSDDKKAATQPMNIGQTKTAVQNGSRDRIAIINPSQRVAYTNKQSLNSQPSTEIRQNEVHITTQNQLQSNSNEVTHPNTFDKKYEINKEMELQKATFGDDLSMINTTQNEENFSLVLDRYNKQSSQHEINPILGYSQAEPVSPPDTTEESKFRTLAPNPKSPTTLHKLSNGNSGNKKHNLQILGKTTQKTVNRRYQDSSSLDRTLDNTKCSDNLINYQIEECFDPFNYQRQSMGPSKVLVNIASDQQMPLQSAQTQNKPKTLSQGHMTGHSYGHSQGNSQGNNSHGNSLGSQKVSQPNSGIPKPRTSKANSSGDNASTQATNGKKVLSQGSKDSLKQRTDSNTQSTNKLPTHSKQQFSMSHGSASAKQIPFTKKHRTEEGTPLTPNGKMQGTGVRANVTKDHGLMRPNNKAKPDSTGSQKKKNFTQKSWITQEDRKFFLQLSIEEQNSLTQQQTDQNEETKNNSEIDAFATQQEQAQIDQLRLQPEFTSDEKSMQNPFISHERRQLQ